MKIDSSAFCKLSDDLDREATQARVHDDNNRSELILSIKHRFESCVAHEDDDTEGVERDKAMLKAFQEIAVGVEGIRSELAQARGQWPTTLPPIGIGGTARIKT